MLASVSGPRRLHVTGASGSGTTTLGRRLAARFGVAHLDTDAYYWAPTDPPFREARPADERLGRLRAALDAAGEWVLSGSLGRWADPLKGRLGEVVLLAAPTPVRLARLRAREAAAFGAALEPGGPLHEQHLEFLRWAGSYDEGPVTQRSRAFHEAWLAELTCPVLRLDGERPPAEAEAIVIAWCAAPVLRRQAARALVLDPQDRLLLLRIREPEAGRELWLAPGGGLEPGEEPVAALRRELAEEVGLTDARVGPAVWTRRHAFTWGRRRYDQQETFFLVRAPAGFAPTLDGNPAAAERAASVELRWWTAAEIAASAATFVPRRLAHELARLRGEGPPLAPRDVGV